MRFVARKTAQLAVVLLVTTFLTFLLLNLIPGGDDTAVIASAGPGVSAEQAEQIKDDLGLNDFLLVGYAKWLRNAAQGDFGNSYATKQPVGDYLFGRLGISLRLMIYAQVLALLIAVPLGVISAYRENSWFDKASNTAAFGLLALPNFILAVLLVFFFSVRQNWFPAIGYVRISTDVVAHVKSMLLPSLSLALGLVATYTRLLRTDMLATLREDFIGMARAKGLPTWHILLRHALRPSMFSLLTAFGINVGALIGGTLVIETIFGLPGMGSAVITAIFQRDYLVVQAAVVIICVAVVLVNFAVDMLYAVLDPRIRHARSLA